ncbi:thiamine phosphate synthase [Virgibacillus pantothenticus]|nr:MULTISPECIES: thiamine phosphate synthase [Virgibacillus]MBU8565253.1 thiamine phosphate synthase [Virgibacillus pantothenticus]MBU8599528.1 thiamine phosphate synthase [Virgibacillus pantothenticus]MBU8633572.1 thiamine phosphate synthase [Virgibacillus pantothenticus]MBU8641808.1 thiamine phosphate synthase [Virgibacillus pantothenticus]MBU8645451.1 thiamine phosphate synthase [Virgibacillus pantothenticus]
MGSQNCDRDPKQILEEAIQAGITAFQYREKGQGSLSGFQKYILGKELRNICKQYDIPFFVNDDVELTQVLDADGIHVGQDDVNALELRQRFPNKWIGLSISNMQELQSSPLDHVDYLGVGPIFATTTKEDAKAAVGTDWIKQVKQLYPNMPIVGIGGISTENAASVLESGAEGVAIISAITKAKNINEAVAKL